MEEAAAAKRQRRLSDLWMGAGQPVIFDQSSRFSG
jgi:hypothetical protein